MLHLSKFFGIGKIISDLFTLAFFFIYLKFAKDLEVNNIIKIINKKYLTKQYLI